MIGHAHWDTFMETPQICFSRKQGCHCELRGNYFQFRNLKERLRLQTHKMCDDVEMDCQPLDLRIIKRAPNHAKNVHDEKFDSGYKSSDLELDCRSVGFESITDRFQKDLTINSSISNHSQQSQTKLPSSDERCVSVDEGYSSGSLRSGDLERLSSDSLRTKDSLTPVHYDAIQEETEKQDKTSDSVEDSYLIEIFSQDDDGDTQVHIGIIQYLELLVLQFISVARVPDWLNIKNDRLQSPLHLAVLTKQPVIVRRLMVAGAQVESPDRNGNTPLHLAVREGYTPIVEALVEAVTKDEREEVQLCYEPPYQRIPQNIEARNYDGQVCLHLAAEGNYQEILEILLSIGANINQRDGKSGRTILHYAAESGNLSLLSFLLRYPQLDINASTYGGLTPIMLAKGRGHHSVVEVLKGAGAQYDSSDESIDEEMSEDSLEDGRHITNGS